MYQCSETYPFTFVVPTLVNDENLVNINVPEDEHALYSSTATYSIGDRVVVAAGYHKIYESVANTNLDKFPPTHPDFWVEVGPTNAWSAFDESGGTKLSSPTEITFSVTGDRFNSLAFLGIQAASVRVVAESLVDGVYYDQTFVIEDQGVVLNWYQYFYSQIILKTELLVTDIPPIGGSTYTITITPPGVSNAELETFVMGMREEFGLTQYGASAGIVDYSKKEVDQFGRAQLVRRNYSKRMDVNLWLDKAETDFFYRRLVELRARPALWIAARGQYETLTIYGFYRDFNIDIAYPSVNFCSLQVEGLS